jgi:tRNA nucleotidyltransferase (CCA-adding enzyme)
VTAPGALAAQVPTAVVSLCERLREAGHEAFVVGGCVRDLLLRRTPPDWDMATSARPEEVVRLFKRVIPTGMKHGTVTVLMAAAPGAELPVEVTTYRGEGAYSDGRRPDSVHFVRTLTEDLARRDFTINAMALDPLAGHETLADPFGGQADLAARLIRAVGDPLERFGEDGLRIMRALRFASTLEMELDPATLAAIPARLEVLARVSWERVTGELMKLLGGRRPSRALDLIEKTGVLKVILPEMLPAVGCTQNRYHALDVWQHTLLAVDNTPLDVPGGVLVRLAALLHDVAKPTCRAENPQHPGEFTFYKHDHVGADMCEAIGLRLRLSNAQREHLCSLVGHHLFYYTAEWTDATVRRFINRVGAERLPDLFALRTGDVCGRGRGEDPETEIAELRARVEKELSQRSALKVTDLCINGRDVMTALGIPPSRRVGQMLEALLERVLDDPSLNERERLVALLPEVHELLPPPAAKG